MLPKVPGAIGSNPIPNPVTTNKDRLEKTSFNLSFILFRQLFDVTTSRSPTFENKAHYYYQTSAYIVLMIYGICSHDHTF